MPNIRLAQRYAKALLDIAVEKGELETVHTDILWLQQVCKTNRDVVNLLNSPIIKPDTKKKVFEAAFQLQSPISIAFINLLVSKTREKHLPEIITAFVEQYKQKNNIRTVTVTTAVPMTATMRQSFLSQIKTNKGFDKVEMVEKVSPELIGGFVLQVGDKLIDASIAYDLKNISRQFKNNDFIYGIR